jgi:hypothetical protein
MWEENPKYQEANYRLLVWTVAIVTIGGLVISYLSDDWGPYQLFLKFLGIILGALCIYATVVWTGGHLTRILCNAFKKLRTEGTPANKLGKPTA